MGGLQLLYWKHGGSCTDQQKVGSQCLGGETGNPAGTPDWQLGAPPESRDAPNQDAVVYRYAGQAAVGLSLLRKHPPCF
jgi:hypothetical protein